mmetsp:Transcript_69879/g.202522  ORF Transcript_69879/g.202522 Transcript_69879/m.202522 type:complete len:218 (-) Transcript_69879:1128-1781(-)
MGSRRRHLVGGDDGPAGLVVTALKIPDLQVLSGEEAEAHAASRGPMVCPRPAAVVCHELDAVQVRRRLFPAELHDELAPLHQEHLLHVACVHAGLRARAVAVHKGDEVHIHGTLHLDPDQVSSWLVGAARERRADGVDVRARGVGRDGARRIDRLDGVHRLHGLGGRLRSRGRRGGRGRHDGLPDRGDGAAAEVAHALRPPDLAATARGVCEGAAAV